MNSKLNTLKFLLNSDDYSARTRVLKFLKSELNQRNTEVLENFFTRLSNHKMMDKFFKEELFEIVLRSHWPKAHELLAHMLAASPYYMCSALHVLSANDQVFDRTVQIVLDKWLNSEEDLQDQIHLWESLALSAIQNNKPDLYALCHQRSLKIDSLVHPFEAQHSRFCEHAVENGSWWAIKSMVGDGVQPHVFYKVFEDASKFAPVQVLQDLYKSSTALFTTQFAGRASEFLCNREQTSEIFELVSKIILQNDQIKLNSHQEVWKLCQFFFSVPKYTVTALQVAERIWLSTEPLFLMRRVLDGKGEVKANIPFLRHISTTQPESYATLFNSVQRGTSKFALHPKIIDDLLFEVDEMTDQLIVQKGYDTEKVNILRQKININTAIEPKANENKPRVRKI